MRAWTNACFSLGRHWDWTVESGPMGGRSGETLSIDADIKLESPTPDQVVGLIFDFRPVGINLSAVFCFQIWAIRGFGSATTPKGTGGLSRRVRTEDEWLSHWREQRLMESLCSIFRYRKHLRPGQAFWLPPLSWCSRRAGLVSDVPRASKSPYPSPFLVPNMESRGILSSFHSSSMFFP